MERNSTPAFLIEFSIWTSGLMAGAPGSQNGKILRLQLPGKKGPLYMGPAGEGFGRGVRGEAVI
jgi:hypothetical protein